MNMCINTLLKGDSGDDEENNNNNNNPKTVHSIRINTQAFCCMLNVLS
jgi:hypothetical protein